MLIDSNELLGKSLGSCTLQRLIGRGGMGAVYLASQARPRRTVAVKVLMPAMAMEQRPRAEFLARFRREADAIAALDHVNIMPIYEYGEQEDIAYLVMPYVTGGTLRDSIEKRGTLPLEEIVPIIEQAAAALDTAHRQNIIHRDLKPGNMLFHADGRLLLADFGLAKVLRDPSEEAARKQTELTSAGTIIGTPEYLSPEQGTGRPLDYRTDVYSLGIVLYQMIAGRVPFTGTTPVAIAIKHALEAPPPLNRFNPTVSPEIEAIVQKTLAKQPDQRYASAGELAQTLRAALEKIKEQEGKKQEAVTIRSDGRTPPDEQEDNQLEQRGEIKREQEQQEFEMAIEDYPTQHEEGKKIVKETPMKLADREKEERKEPPDDIHTDKTEETPRVEKEVAVAAQAPETDHRYEREQGDKLHLPATGPRPEQRGEPVRQRGLQPVGMMLLGSFLTLLIIVGGLGAYTQFLVKKPQVAITQHSQSTPTGTKVSSTSPTPNKPQTVSLPAAMIAPAKTLLYGTDEPGTSCDKRGGEWSSTTNAQISCGQATTMHNSDQAMLAGTFLDKLPQGKTMPADYVLQVQVTVNAASTGNFGVFVRNQPGQQAQGTYSVLLAPPNTWKMYEYQNSSGAATALVQGIPTQATLTGTFTIDVLVQGDTYTLFINGSQEGYAQSGTYMTGNIGLAVDAGADVSFKNLEVFALQ